MDTPNPNPDFRPNPERCIFLTGIVAQDTLDALVPSILKLQAQSRGPITLYIDSPGGNTFHADKLEQILKAKQQDYYANRLITVATSVAASAASDLLLAGDYALAYPHSIIHCHGIRMGQDEITHEGAVGIARFLSERNETFALRTAYNCIFRFMFRFTRLRADFADLRQMGSKEKDIECFVRLLQTKVSPDLQSLLKNALEQSAEIDELANYLKTVPPTRQKGNAAIQIWMIKGILDFEYKRHKRDTTWTLLDMGFEGIEEKFHLLVDSRGAKHHERMIALLCMQWKNFFLTDEQLGELDKLSEESQVDWLKKEIGEQLRPIWFLLVAICRSLQKGEFRLSAEDAYWLGLIDEVIGREDLPSLRQIVEYADNVEPNPEP